MRTQKALGVQWLASNYQHYSDVRVPITHYCATPEEAEAVPSTAFPLFARPCPVTPRHGFVDSRVVNSPEDLRALFSEARAADPEAELMLMPTIAAALSAVLTPTWAAIGAGNDGATAGKAGTLNLRLAFTSMPAPDDLIPEGQIPYAELLYDNRPTMYAVQWRSGPPVDGGIGDYIPADVTITDVINANTLNAMGLEKAVTDAVPGTVIWQPYGNPCSHAACHARLHKVPILFSPVVPEIGTRLTATASDETPLDVAAFRQSLNSCTRNHVLPRHLPRAVLWAVHQASALCQSPEGARFAAYAVMDVWRYAAVACIGEARHSRTGKTGRPRLRKVARNTIYYKSLSKTPTDFYLRSALKHAHASFKKKGEYPGGFGGGAWAECAEATRRLYQSIAEISNGKGDVLKAIAAAHVVINTAHNNGKFLNKFCGSDNFDEAAGGNWIMAGQSLRALYVHNEMFRREHTAAAAWPLLRNRGVKVKRPKTGILQWNIRGSVGARLLHIQYGRSHNYKSANLPFNCLDSDTVTRIVAMSSAGIATYSSFADSERVYWRTTLPATVIALIQSILV